MPKVVKHAHEKNNVKSSIKGSELVHRHGSKIDVQPERPRCKLCLFDSLRLLFKIHTENVGCAQFLQLQRKKTRTAADIKARLTPDIGQKGFDEPPAFHWISDAWKSTGRIRPYAGCDFEIVKPRS